MGFLIILTFIVGYFAITLEHKLKIETKHILSRAEAYKLKTPP